MKRNIGLIILIFIMCVITAFLAYIVISKQSLKRENFNVKVGEVLKFKDYNVNIEILNIAKYKCKDEKKCDTAEIEVSLKVNYNNEESNYTLKSNGTYYSQIKNSNYYVILKYDNEKIDISVKDKKEM